MYKKLQIHSIFFIMTFATLAVEASSTPPGSPNKAKEIPYHSPALYDSPARNPYEEAKMASHKKLQELTARMHTPKQPSKQPSKQQGVHLSPQKPFDFEEDHCSPKNLKF